MKPFPHVVMKPRSFAIAAWAMVQTASAATANWKNNTSGNWSDTANWNPATVPDAAGTVVRYTHSGGGSLSGTVTLNQNATAGIIDHQTGVGGSTGVFTVARSGSFALTMDNTGGVANLFGNSNAAIIGIGNSNTFNITQVHSDIVIANTDLDIGSQSGGVLIGTSANSSTITASTNQNLNLRWNAGNTSRNIIINAAIGGSGAGTITLNNVGSGTAGEVTTVNGTIGAQVTSINQNTTQALLNLTGSNTAFAGTTNLQAGTLQANHANALGSSGNITFSGGALQYTSASAGQNWASRFKNSSTGPIALTTNGQNVSLTAIDNSNTGGLTKLGTGTLNLNGANTYTGDTRSNAGTLALGHVNALSASTLDMNAADAGAVTFTVSGSNTYNVGALKGSRNLSGNNNTLSIGGNNLSTEYSGSLGNGALTKTGSGTLTLSGANTHGGTTAIDNGTLAVTGSGSINSTSGVSISSTGTFRYNSSVAYTGGAVTNNGGTITGTGDIGVSLTLDSLADKLAPGNSPGIQHYSVGQTWNSFTYQWETNDFTGTNAGTHFDQLAITGALSLTGGAGSYALDVLSLTGTNAAGAVPNFSETSRQWTVLTTTDGISGFNAAYWNIVTGGFTSSPTWTGSFSLTADSNNIYLNYAAVPEPSAALLAGLGLLALWRRRRSLDPEFDASKPATDGISHPQPSQSCPSGRSLS